MLVYLRDGSALIIVRAATLRKKLQLKLSTSPSHSILTPGLPVPALILNVWRLARRTPDAVGFTLRLVGLVGLVSVHCDLVRQQTGSATSISVCQCGSTCNLSVATRRTCT